MLSLKERLMSPPLSLFLLSLFLFPGICFPARIPPGAALSTLTVSPKDVNPTWRDFGRLKDAERGNRLAGISELKKYFSQFGYFPDSNFTDAFDDRLESAVRLYQLNFGLPVSGRLDSDTVSAISVPRCGVHDQSPVPIRTTRRYAFFSGKPRWTQSDLTYAFSPSNMIDYLNPVDIRTAFRRAFARWAAVIPINFSETPDYFSADVKIGFFSGDHGDGEPFDGVLGVLAHAFSPDNGRLHLDARERWAVDFKSEKSMVAVDLESVATHEIGHILGLAHTTVKEAVMYPSLNARARKVDLTRDDVEGAQALYGSNPNFKLSSLSEPVTSDAALHLTTCFGIVTRFFLGGAFIPILFTSL